MGAVGVRLRTEIRHGWRSWLVLVLLIGAFSGVVLGVAAGARRTTTAYPRLLERSGPSSALIGAFNTGLDGFYDKLATRREVDQFALLAGMPVFPADEDGQPVFINGNAVAPIDGRWGYDMGRPDILAGRLPRRDAADEVLINEVAARTLHVRVGSTLSMVAAEPDPADSAGEAMLLTPVTAKVVGLGRMVDEVIPTTKFDTTETIFMTPAAYHRWGEGKRLNWDAAFVRVRDPGDMPAFRAAAERLAAADPDQTGGQVLFADHVERNRLVNRTIAPQAMALWLFTAFAGIAGYFVLGQALSRQITDDAGDAAVLRSLGFTRRQLFAVAFGRATVVTAGVVVLAVAVAIAISPLFPIGAARKAEFHDGVDVNLALLGLGALAIVVLLLARAAIPAWRQARTPGVRAGDAVNADEGSPTTRKLVASGLPPSAAAGVRMALEPGRGRTAVPVRTTIIGAVLGLAAVAATITFGANMSRLIDTPRLYGRAWSLTFDGSFGSILADDVRPVLDNHDVVDQWSGGYYGEATLKGQQVAALGLRGPVGPVVVQGRAPRNDGEVALGTTTLRRAGHRVGDRVDLVILGQPRPMTVVGRAVFPAMGRGSFSQTGVGEGALTTATAVAPPSDPELEAFTGGRPYFNFFLVRLGEDASASDVARLRRQLLRFCPEDQDCRIVLRPTEEQPAQIANLDRIRWTPVVLAAVLAALAVATVGHTLVASIRRRRRDLALLKAIGFVRRQVSAAVAWQATTIALIAVVVGLPLGLALGRVLWRALAEQMGIVPDVVTPGLALLLAAPATLVLVNLIAVVPGWMAGRVRPGVALRAE